MTTYNYACINDECDVRGNIPVKKEDVFEDREEYCYQCDKPMKQLGYISNLAIKGDIQTRMLRNQEHFRKRAKEHSNSAEEKFKKKQRNDQELSSYTRKKIKS